MAYAGFLGSLLDFWKLTMGMDCCHLGLYQYQHQMQPVFTKTKKKRKKFYHTCSSSSIKPKCTNHGQGHSQKEIMTEVMPVNNKKNVTEGMLMVKFSILIFAIWVLRMFMMTKNNKNNKHLMTCPKGNSEFCFRETLNVS